MFRISFTQIQVNLLMCNATDMQHLVAASNTVCPSIKLTCLEVNMKLLLYLAGGSSSLQATRPADAKGGSDRAPLDSLCTSGRARPAKWDSDHTGASCAVGQMLRSVLLDDQAHWVQAERSNGTVLLQASECALVWQSTCVPSLCMAMLWRARLLCAHSPELLASRVPDGIKKRPLNARG